MGSSLQMWTLWARVGEERGGMLELEPQLWSSALALPQSPWSLWAIVLSSGWLRAFVPLKDFRNASVMSNGNPLYSLWGLGKGASELSPAEAPTPDKTAGNQGTVPSCQAVISQKGSRWTPV